MAQLRASRAYEAGGLRRKPVHDATLSAGAKVPLKRGKSTANGLAQKAVLASSYILEEIEPSAPGESRARKRMVAIVK